MSIEQQSNPAALKARRDQMGAHGRAGAFLIMLALGCALTPVRAEALEIFGHKLFDLSVFGIGQSEEDINPEAQPYEIEFVVAGDDPDLADPLQGGSRLYADRDKVPSNTAAFLARGRGDYQRIVAALYGQGRYGGSVLIEANGLPIEEIPPDAVLANPVQVVVRIEPGPVFVFGDIGIAGRPPPVLGDDDVPPSPEEIGLVPGALAKSGIVLEVEEALVGMWRENGHPKARIQSRNTTANQQQHTLDVAIVVDPGLPAVLGPLAVTGTERMDPDFVAHYTALQSGKPYDPDDLDLARRQLRRLEVFKVARIVEGDAVSAGGELPLAVNVAERPLRVVGVGASYSTLDGAGAEGYWQHRNLFGQAERFRVDGRVGGIVSGFVEDYDYFLGTTFVKPGAGSPFTDFTATTFVKQEVPETYLEQTAGGTVGLSHRYSETLEGEIAISIEATHIEDPFGNRDFVFSSLPGELTYDDRDDRLDATEGYRVALSVEPFHEFNRNTTGVISRLDASTYYSFDPDNRWVLAARGAIGSLVGAPRDELPASKLFFAGGGGSVRGYAYRNIGPRLANGDIVGGRSLIEASAELRARVSENISIVPFLDAGNAYTAAFPDLSEDLRLGAGVGLRYETGLGPLRFDIAVPLNPQDGDPDTAFYIGLGQAF